MAAVSGSASCLSSRRPRQRRSPSKSACKIQDLPRALLPRHSRRLPWRLSPVPSSPYGITSPARYSRMFIEENNCGYFFFDAFNFLNSARALRISAKNVSSACKLANAPEIRTLDASTSLCQWKPAITRLCPHS